MQTSVDLVDASLAAIAEYGERTNAFILVDAEGARAAARAADEERRRGIDRGPLHGVPISVKDLFDVAGWPTTAASRARAGHVADRDATVVQRLREAGVVLIGKTNLHEFALGTTSDVSAWGPVHNPRDLARSAGGSSGGSAAAVATGMGRASIGSDTGGSIRIPAAACGVVGLKPSFGEVPVDGVVPLSTSFDHVGPITRSVADAAAFWGVLTGRAIPLLEPRHARSLRLGLLNDYFTALLSSEVRVAFDSAVDRLRRAGVAMEPRSVSGTNEIVDTYVNISLPEAALWHAGTLDTRPEDYQPPVRERLERGRTISAVNYLRAQERRIALTVAVNAALPEFDALVLPALAIIAPPLGSTDVAVERADGGSEMIAVRAAMLRLTQLFNMTGHPAISLPIQTSGLPVGLQLVGHQDRTSDLLDVAAAVESILGG